MMNSLPTSTKPSISNRKGNMKKFAAATVLALASFAAVLPISAWAEGSSAAQRPTCSIQYIVGRSACYAPSQVATAEARAPFAVRPSPAVGRVLGLHLSQVIVYWDNPNAKTPTHLDYIYGALRHDYGRAPALPESVVVTVSPGHAQGMERRYLHSACGTTFEVSQAALNHPYRSWGPWYLRGSFGRGTKQFAITANVQQSRLLQLACAVRRLG